MAEKILSMIYGNVGVHTTLHDTVSDNGSSQVGSLRKGCRQEEVNTKINLQVTA